jgi:hypothetical protein
MNRRAFLKASGLAGMTYWLARSPVGAASAADAMVSGNVTWPAGKTIPDGVRVRFDPYRSTTVTVPAGNVVVAGILEMRPASPGVVHTLRFTGIRESAFQGQGDDVVASDRGLWVRSGGRLDIAGAGKEPWARAEGSLAPGDSGVVLDRDPSGWQPGDEVAVTPTGSWTGYPEREFEIRTIESISERTVYLSSALAQAHPAVSLPEAGSQPARTYGAEILNLTRNVRIEGTPSGRTHVFVKSTVHQSITFASLRHMGPQKGGRTVKGRWGLHLHRMGDAARGSLIEGVVVRDAGGHAFATHASHGVTFRSCIAHSVQTSPYWWDPWERAGKHFDHSTLPDANSHDIVYDRCVASLVTGTPSGEANYRLTAFSILMGSGNRCVGCVAVGVLGAWPGNGVSSGMSSGFGWPENQGGDWTFEDNLAHNCRGAGLFGWQNVRNVRAPIRRFASYACGTGIYWGAYLNHQDFEDSVLWSAGHAAITHGALPGLDNRRGSGADPIVYRNVVAAGKYAVLFHELRNGQRVPLRFQGCTFGYWDRGVEVTDRSSPSRVDLDFVDCSWLGQEGREFSIDPQAPQALFIRIQDPTPHSPRFGDGSVALRRRDRPGGVLVPEWGAKRYNIARFA